MLNFISIKSGRTIAAIGALIALVALVGYLAMPREVEIEHAAQFAQVVRDAPQQGPASEAVTTRDPIAAATPLPTRPPVEAITPTPDEGPPPTEFRFRLRRENGIPEARREFRVELVGNESDATMGRERVLATHFLITDGTGDIIVPNDPDATSVLVMDVRRELQVRYGLAAWARFAKVATDVQARHGYIPLQVRPSHIKIRCRIIDPEPLAEADSYYITVGQFEVGFRPNDRFEPKPTGMEFEFRAEQDSNYLVEVGRRDPDLPEYCSQRAITKVTADGSGGDVFVEIRFEERTTLHGTVLLPGGAPASGLRVSATMQRAGRPERYDEFGNRAISNVTGEDGSWSVSAPKSDEVTLRIMDENGTEQNLYYPHNGEAGRAYVRAEKPTSQPVPDEPRFQSFDLELKYAPMVRGLVMNRDGSPSPEALVSANEGRLGNAPGGAVTDERGRFEFPYRLEVPTQSRYFLLAWGAGGIGATEFTPNSPDPVVITLSPLVTVHVPVREGRVVLASVEIDLDGGPVTLYNGITGSGVGIEFDFAENDPTIITVANVPAGISTIQMVREINQIDGAVTDTYRVTADGKVVSVP